MQREITKHRARGWLRVSRRHGEKMQQSALSDLCGAIYRADDPDGMSDLLRSLRPGDAVMVTTLGRLASKWRFLVDALEAIRESKAILIETTTGRRSDVAADVVAMMDAARSELVGEAKALTPRRAKAAAKKRWDAEHQRRMPKDEAERVWKHDRRYATTTEAISVMPGWSLSAAYRNLGPRGTPAGRPRQRTR